MNWTDGIINLDSSFGKLLGFTSDKFDGWLWKTGNRITISFIVSKQPRRGNLSRLFKKINDYGFYVAVPTPFALMKHILKKKGFEQKMEYDRDFQDNIEIWVQSVPAKDNGSKQK